MTFAAVSLVLLVGLAAVSIIHVAASGIDFVPPPIACESSGPIESPSCANLYDAYPHAADVGTAFAGGADFRLYLLPQASVRFVYNQTIPFNTLCFQQSTAPSHGSWSDLTQYIQVYAGGVTEDVLTVTTARPPIAAVQVPTESRLLFCHPLSSAVTAQVVGFRLSMAAWSGWYMGGATLALAFDPRWAAPVEPTVVPFVQADEPVSPSAVVAIVPAPATCGANSTFPSSSSTCAALYDAFPTRADIGTRFSRGESYAGNMRQAVTFWYRYDTAVSFNAVCYQQMGELRNAIAWLDVFGEDGTTLVQRIGLAPDYAPMLDCYALAAPQVNRRLITFAVVMANYSTGNVGGATLVLATVNSSPAAAASAAPASSSTSDLRVVAPPARCTQSADLGSTRSCRQLFDAAVTAADLNSPFPAGLTTEYRLQIMQPASVLLHYGAPVTFNTVCVQLLGGDRHRWAYMEVFVSYAGAGFFTAVEGHSPVATVALHPTSTALVCYRLRSSSSAFTAPRVALRFHAATTADAYVGAATVALVQNGSSADDAAAALVPHVPYVVPAPFIVDPQRALASLLPAPVRCSFTPSATGNGDCRRAFDVVPTLADVNQEYTPGYSQEFVSDLVATTNVTFEYADVVNFDAVCFQPCRVWAWYRFDRMELFVANSTSAAAASAATPAAEDAVSPLPTGATPLRCYALSRSYSGRVVTARLTAANYSVGGSCLATFVLASSWWIAPTPPPTPSQPSPSSPGSGAGGTPSSVASSQEASGGSGATLIVLAALGGAVVASIGAGVIACIVANRRTDARRSAANGDTVGNDPIEATVVGVIVASPDAEDGGGPKLQTGYHTG